MHIDWVGGLNFSLQFPIRPEGMILLGIYLLTTLTILFLLRDSILAMRKREWLIFFGLGALTLILSNVISVRFAAPDFQPVPNLPQDTAMPAAPLFAAVPLLAGCSLVGHGAGRLAQRLQRADSSRITERTDHAALRSDRLWTGRQSS